MTVIEDVGDKFERVIVTRVELSHNSVVVNTSLLHPMQITICIKSRVRHRYAESRARYCSCATVKVIM